MNPLFARQSTSVFERMSALAREHQAVNLGQGFPDYGWPDAVVARAAEALRQGSNQYPPMRGLPELREAVAAHYGTDAEHVTITSGATEALAASMMALISPGDEVVLFQPLYDAYLPLVLRAGGVPRLIRLEPPGWRITKEALDAAFAGGARLVLFNNPHNPTGRVFDPEELRLLAEACVANDAVAVSDEVWEHVVFDGRAHVPLSSLPGMAERTMKIGSAGKIFALTGWKVGWMVAPLALSAAAAKAHQFLTFSTAPNLQSAVAWGLGHAGEGIARTCAEYQQTRDFMRDGLAATGFAVLPGEGTYFMNVDLADSGISADDLSFCERAVREAGVAAIPVSAFYAEDPVRSVVRLCFAKRTETLRSGISALAEAKRLFA